MSKPKGKNPTRTSEKRSAAPTNFTLSQADRMMPLVKHITVEIHDRWKQLQDLEREQEDLDRRRLKLEWKDRNRRYSITDEINQVRRRLQEAGAELEGLKVLMVDPLEGEIAFPTLIHGRRAYYVWRLGMDHVHWWCYANEPNRRIIPTSWRKKKEAVPE